MRPVNKGASNPGYNPPTTFTFQKNSIAAKTLGTTTPTVAACLDTWFDVAWRIATQKKRINPDLVVTSNAIQGKVEDTYKLAGVPLVTTIGSYCSYCETPIPGLLEVEHIVPKSEYPAFSIDWSNFLLSCGPCNNAKSDDPSRETVATKLGIAYTQTTPTQAQCQTYIRNTMYIWPDNNPHTYRALPPMLYYLDTAKNQWTLLPVDSNNSANLNNTITSFDLLTRTVIADVYIGGTLYTGVQVAVLIQNNTVPAPVGQATIDLLDLDGLSPKQTSTYDRRMMNRTQAWFTILQQMRILSSVTTQSAFDTVWPFIPMSAVGTGFYSVWVTLLNTMTDPNGTNLAVRFVADTNKANMYPNTDTTYIP